MLEWNWFFLRLGTLLQEIGNVNEDGGKTIIFVETKKKVENITRNIRRYGWPAVCMHGDKSQQERDYVLRGKINKIFITDLQRVWLSVINSRKTLYCMRIVMNICR